MPKKKTVESSSRIVLPPGAVIYGEVTLTTDGGVTRLQIHGAGGPYRSLVARKNSKEFVLPSGTLISTSQPSPDWVGKFVAWDGEAYVVQPTLESIQDRDDLTLVGKVVDPPRSRPESPLLQYVKAYNEIKELVDGPHQEIHERLVRQVISQQYGCKPEEVTWEQIRFEVSGLLPTYRAIRLIPSTPIQSSSNSRVADLKVPSTVAIPPVPRLSGAITCPSAARKMEAYLERKGMGLTAFAIQAQTTDRTLRSFRTTGKVRRDIFESIAKAMGVSKEDLLAP